MASLNENEAPQTELPTRPGGESPDRDVAAAEGASPNASLPINVYVRRFSDLETVRLRMPNPGAGFKNMFVDMLAAKYADGVELMTCAELETFAAAVVNRWRCLDGQGDAAARYNDSEEDAAEYDRSHVDLYNTNRCRTSVSLLRFET